MPNKEDWAKWDSSPLLAPEEWFAKVPNAWIGVAELDILRDEGLAYAEKLKKAGVHVEVRQYKRAPHPIMAMDGKCTKLYHVDPPILPVMFSMISQGEFADEYRLYMLLKS